jgi:uncharacterized membrane protein
MIWYTKDEQLEVRLTIPQPVAMRLPTQLVNHLTSLGDTAPVSASLMAMTRIALYLELEERLHHPYQESWQRIRKLDQDWMLQIVQTLCDEMLMGDAAKSFMIVLKERLQVMPTEPETP